MIYQRCRFSFIAVILFTFLKMCIGEDGETGHFQVHNEQEGSLKIHATKEVAQIETQANSVQVVLEPGKVNAPKEGTSESKGNNRQTIHVESPEYFQGFRRSKVNRKIGTRNSERIKRALIEGEKTFENSIKLEKWKKDNWDLIKSNINGRHSKERRSLNLRRYKKENMKSKKSEIEKVTRVHGRTGGLHVTTGKRGTKLISKSGALNVFIRNENEKEEKDKEIDENSDRRSYDMNPALNGKSEYHVVNAKMDGLSLKRREVIDGRTTCLMPPCVP